MHYEDKKSGFKFDAVSGVPKENTVEAFEELFSVNKAAEEGELPLWHHNEYDKSMHPDPCGEWHKASDVQAFIAADRASRQVANKAEVEQKALFEFLKHGDEVHKAWLQSAIEAFFSGKGRPDVDASVPPATTGGAEVDTQRLDFLGSASVVSLHQYEPNEGEVYIAIDLDAPGSPTVRGANIREAIDKAMGSIATPPATTGASTAPTGEA